MAELRAKIKTFFLVTLWQELPEKTHAIWRGVINSLRVSYIVIRELAEGKLKHD